MEILQPKIGERVRVRQHTWVVRDVDAYPECRVLTLAPTWPGAPAFRRVILPFDDVELADGGQSARRVGMRTWRRACLGLIAEHGDASAMRTAAAARIELLPYQLEPALALLRGFGSRLLLADEVGLGKTVQAMLAVAELRARGLADRVLVLCPAGLREQWAQEWRTRVALPFAVLDQAGLSRARLALPHGLNPWRAEPLVVASVDYVKRPEVLPSVLAVTWDVVVVDEAHGACGHSERRQAVSELCGRAPYVLLLSATPHNGDEDAFTSLCALGRHDDHLVVFRRSRLEAGRDGGRRAHTVRVPPSAAERQMLAALAALTRAIRRESTDMDRHVWLLLSLLHKRALSSAHALATSAERRLQVLGEIPDGVQQQLFLPLDDESGELDGSDAAPMWSSPALRDGGRERRLLQHVVDAARLAEGGEGKLRRLHRLLNRVREPVIVFTEYRDTLLHVRSQVAPNAAVVHGGMTMDQRRAALSAFSSSGVLLATDAAGEGLNLQQQCRAVINLELPWNPMRLEQRIGRVDRIGQRRRVHVFNLVADGTAEVRLLDRLSARVSQANARVGAPNPLFGRPEWTEDASARLVVLRHDSSGGHEPGVGAAPTVPITRLETEGRAESARVGVVRALTAAARGSRTNGTRLSAPSGLVVARTRRRRLRATLLGRTLAVFRTTLSDPTGRIVAARIDAVVGDASGDHAAALAQLGARIRTPGTDAERWLQESVDMHRRFVEARVHRAHSILAWLRQPGAELQPGLFDRRSEQSRQRLATAQQEETADADERIARAVASTQVSVSAPEPVLLLLPRGAAS